MSNIDKQSLRQTAEKAQEHGVFNMDIHSQTVLALLDELEAKDKRIAELTEKPIGWTDEKELRDVEKIGCGYLFNANPITPHADPRRVILLYAAAAGKGE
ncbi:ead/Ea22-like family protein [Enterobacter cloacae subsp. cloacae]|uniref:ead/Ea22-like family protein n=1 Tax=Enterobacter cloacae TaxID=550 RepID=UPI001F5BE979|nr:ead/Ea22-like family protein [Enterobacter cloacae]